VRPLSVGPRQQPRLKRGRLPHLLNPLQLMKRVPIRDSPEQHCLLILPRPRHAVSPFSFHTTGEGVVGPNSTGVRRCLLRRSAAQLEKVPSPRRPGRSHSAFPLVLRRLILRSPRNSFTALNSFLVHPHSHASIVLESTMRSHMECALHSTSSASSVHSARTAWQILGYATFAALFVT
jgi:hypothetical protein